MLSLNVAALREESAQETFLETFGNNHPELSGVAIDMAFREALGTANQSERVELLEREMESRLGIVSDEEE